MRRDELKHYGILGMKWGIRRYQNKDGTFTDAGRKRYGLKETSKRKDVKKAMKISTADKNVKEVGSRYEQELINSPKIKKYYKELKDNERKANEAYAILYNKINPDLKKLNPKGFDYREAFFNNELGDKDGNYNEPFDTVPNKIGGKRQKNSKEESNFWNSVDGYYKAVNNITKEQRKIGEKYVDQFNEARLKDLAYEGNIDIGKKLLNEYGGFHVSPYGSIDTNIIGFNRREYYPDEFYDKYRYSDELWDM